MDKPGVIEQFKGRGLGHSAHFDPAAAGVHPGFGVERAKDDVAAAIFALVEVDFFLGGEGQAGEGGFEKTGVDENALVGEGVIGEVAVEGVDEEAQEQDVGGHREHDNAPDFFLEGDIAEDDIHLPPDGQDSPQNAEGDKKQVGAAQDEALARFAMPDDFFARVEQVLEDGVGVGHEIF